MKKYKEIKKNPRITVAYRGFDGFRGILEMPAWRGSIIASKGGGWEHVSVSPEKMDTVPTWDDMCKIKDMFWDDDEDVIEIHPAKANYVNNMPNCLHLWRCYYKNMILPPSCFVGIRNGQTQSELMAEVRAAYELAGEVYD
jgi:hypothetical protein